MHHHAMRYEIVYWRKKALPSYTIDMRLAESKPIVPADSKCWVLNHQNDVVDKGDKGRDHEMTVMHVTTMCSDKKTCAYQAATTHFPFHGSTT